MRKNIAAANKQRRKDSNMENGIENLTMGAPELAKHSTVNVSLTGWPAAVALMNIPAAVVAVFAIKAFAHC